MSQGSKQKESNCESHEDIMLYAEDRVSAMLKIIDDRRQRKEVKVFAVVSR